MESPDGFLPDYHDQAFRQALLELLVTAQRRLMDAGAGREPLTALQEGVLELTGSQWCILALPPGPGDADDAELLVCRTGEDAAGRPDYRHDAGGLTLTALEPLFRFTLCSGQTMVSNNLHATLDAPVAGLGSILVMPLPGEEETAGVIALANRPGGFYADLADALEPLLLTLGTMLANERTRTRLHQAQQALQRESRLLEAIITHMGDALLIMDCQGHIRHANRAAARLFGHGPESLAGMHGSELVAPRERRHLQRLLGHDRDRPARREMIGLSRDGREIPVELSMQRLASERDCYLIATAHDISQRLARNRELARANRKLERLARRDPLTGLYNRRAFHEAMEREWRRCRRHRAPLALVMADVDHFKRYNDLLGHVSGDDCLKRIARLMKQHFRRAGEMAARVGGEEFAILMPECTERTAMERTETLLRSLRDQAMTHPGQPGPVSLSAGLAMLREEDPDYQALVRRADTALYRAKTGGRDLLVVSDGEPALRGH